MLLKVVTVSRLAGLGVERRQIVELVMWLGASTATRSRRSRREVLVRSIDATRRISFLFGRPPVEFL
jgi:hypothetical protein